MTEKQNTRSFV